MAAERLGTIEVEDKSLTLRAPGRVSQNNFEEVDVQVGDEILTLRVPQGTPDEVVKQRAQELVAGSTARPTTPLTPTSAQPAPTALAPPPTLQQRVRGVVKDLPLPLRVAVESGPSVVGTILGGAAGALTSPVTGPVGPLVGGAVGGGAGEEIAQITGLAPESTFGKVMAVAAPVGGPILGKGFKWATGRFLKLPGVREAVNIRSLEVASQRLLDWGSEIIAKAKGGSAATLFARLHTQNVGINPKDLAHTLSELKKLRAEVKPFQSHPEAQKVLQTIKLLTKDLGVRLPTKRQKKPPGAIRLEDLITVKRLIDHDIRAFEKSATALDVGVKLRAGRRLSYAITNDLEQIARASGKGSQVFELAQAAIARSRLEFGVASLDQTVRANLKAITTGGRVTGNVVDVKALRLELRNMKDHASETFDRDFARALKNHLPQIDKFLQAHENFTVTIGQGGGLVLKGATARATRITLGAVTGGLMGGPTGVLAGGIIGSQASEMLTGIMLTGTGRSLLGQAIRVTGGRVPIQTLAAISQAVVRGVRSTGTGPFVSLEERATEQITDLFGRE